MNAVFGELNKGEGITSSLRKVTDDMKAKNMTDRSGVVAAGRGGTPAIGGGGGKPAAVSAARPPKLALEGTKWAVEHQVGKT